MNDPLPASADPTMNPFNQQVSDAIYERTDRLAAHMVAAGFVRHSELGLCYGNAGRTKCLGDAGYHFNYLAQAISAGDPALFEDYIGWAKVMLIKRGVPATDLECLLETMKESLGQQLPPEWSAFACEFVNAGLGQISRFPNDIACFIHIGSPLEDLATQYLQSLLRGERHIASKLIHDAAARGTPVREIYLQVFQRTLCEIGRLWQVNAISVAHEHYCTAATQHIMSQLYPYITGSDKTRGTMVATCVSGDLHEIGARMVCDFFELDGWHTHYLGANMPTADVLQTVIQLQAGLLVISATIAHHVRAVKTLIGAVRNAPGCGGVKILVGGYPFNVAPDLWRNVGADGSATDAAEAVKLANRLSA